jgi:TetR/AcrR family transcriptional repressor of nem operon
VPKGSFYYFYASKEALALAVVDEHWAEQRREWTRILSGVGKDGGDAGGAQPLDRLRKLFEETEAGQHAVQQGCGTVLGCLFGNLSLEMSNQTEAVRARLQEIFDAQVEMVAAVIDEARDRGDVTVNDSREAARSVVAQLEGQVMFAKLYNNTGRLSPLWGNCLALLGARAA